MSEVQSPIKQPESSSMHADDFGEGTALQMKAAPAFGLTASSPIQRRGYEVCETNYRYDTQQYTARDLQDPAALARLNAMTIAQLQALLPTVRDTDVVDWINHRIQALFVPAAGAIRHQALPMTAADQALLVELRTYLDALPGRMEALVASPPPHLTRLQNNANVRQAIAITRRAAAELRSTSRSFVFHDTLGASGGNTVKASYNSITNQINLLRFRGNLARNETASSLVHEFTHAEQDAAMEESLMQSASGRQAFSREADFARESGGWQNGSYVTAMQSALGDLTGATFDVFMDGAMSSYYDDVQSGTPRERRAAESNIRSRLSGYDAQFDRNENTVWIRVNISQDNHAHLNHRGTDMDLGVIPDAGGSPYQLQGHIRQLVLGMPNALELLQDLRPRRTYNQAVFLVAYRGTRITEFGLARSEFPARARP